MYPGDDYLNYLTPQESEPPRERATHRLAFKKYERERMASVVRPVF